VKDSCSYTVYGIRHLIGLNGLSRNRSRSACHYCTLRFRSIVLYYSNISGRDGSYTSTARYNVTTSFAIAVTFDAVEVETVVFVQNFRLCSARNQIPMPSSEVLHRLSSLLASDQAPSCHVGGSACAMLLSRSLRSCGLRLCWKAYYRSLPRSMSWLILCMILA